MPNVDWVHCKCSVFFSLDKTEMFWQLWKKGSRNPIIGNWVRLAAERLWFCRIRFKQWGLHGGHRIADDSQVYQRSLVAQTVKHLPTMRKTWVRPWVGKIRCRRKWQLTAVLLPGKSYAQRSLVGYSPWGHKESDRTEQLHFSEARSRCLDRCSEERRSPDENR